MPVASKTDFHDAEIFCRAGFEDLREHPWLKPAMERKRWQELHPEPSSEDLSKVMVAPRQMTMVRPHPSLPSRRN